MGSIGLLIKGSASGGAEKLLVSEEPYLPTSRYQYELITFHTDSRSLRSWALSLGDVEVF